MSLSDDELLGIERITIALRDYPEPEHGGVMVSKGIIDHELGRVPDLIAELRAARTFIARVRKLDEGDDWNGFDWQELTNALAEYDTASAEPQVQPA